MGDGGSDGGFDGDNNKFDDYYPHDNYNEFNDEPGGGGGGGSGGGGGGGMQQNQNNSSFRGRGGGGPWRSPGGGGRGGRGHFEGNFGSRGGGGVMQPRFRGGGGGGGGGRGGFGMGSPRGGGPGGPRGGPGPGFMNRGRFRGPGPGHHEMGGGGGGWNNNGPPHGGMGGPPGPGGPPTNPDENVWAEARSPDGKIYFYHTKTRETTWDRPEGPNVRIVRHDEWSSGMMKQNQDNGGGFPGGGPKGGPMDQQQPHHGQPPGGNFPNQGPPMMGGPPGPGGPPPQGPPFNLQVPPPGHGQGPPPNQVPGLPPGPGMQGLPPQMQGPPPGLGPNQPAIRPMLNSNGPPGAGPDGKLLPMFPGSGPPPGQFRPGGPGPALGLGHGHGPGPGPGPRFPGVPGESGSSQVPPGEEISIKGPEGQGGGGVPGGQGQLPVVPLGGGAGGPGPGPGPVPVPLPGHAGVMHPPGAMPFGPFGGGVGPMGPPPFGLPPPVYPPSFPIAPPPWGLPPGVPPPTGVPPPAMQFEHLAFSQVDPKIVAKAYEWTEHASPDGKVYFFNAKTQQSIWEKPTALIEFEAAKLVAQQRLGSAPPAATAAVTTTKEKPVEKVESNTESKVKEAKREKKSSMGEKCRPISSTPVSGTPWCVVWTGDKRVFFYNPSNKTSVWEKPQELIGRYDVEELLKACPETTKNAGKVKKAEATSTTSPLSDADKLALEGQRENQIGSKGATDHHSMTASVLPTATVNPVTSHNPSLIKIEVNLKERKLSTSSSVTAMDDESSNEEGKDGPPAKRSKREDKESRAASESRGGGSGADVEIIEDDQDVILMKETRDGGKGSLGADGDDDDEGKGSEKVKIETKDGFKEMTALEAEVKAARERAIVPIDVRMTKFREMLIEKQVSAFSTWEKELHKIVFDPRYLYLTSKERKTAFDVYVKERAEEERKEKKKMLKQVKEQFVKFLENCHVSQKMTFSEFSQKYGRDERFRNVEKAREREQYFNDYIQDLKKRDKEERASKKERAREDLLTLLKDRIKDYHLKWPEVKKKLDIDKDSRFDVLEHEEKEDIFKIFQKKLKTEVKAKEKKKKKEKKEKDRERKRKEKEKSQTKEAMDASNPLGLDNIDSNEEDHDMNVKMDGGRDKEDDPDADEKSSDDKVEDVSEEEEGCITDDSDDDQRMEREKKERAEVSLREREREVQRTLATHLRDRDKEREFYQHEEAVQEFQALLTDLVRNVDMTWKEAKKLIKKDRRWDSVSILSRDEMEDLFNQHGDSISRKKKARFRELLDESRVKLNTTWKEIRKRIKEDPRYTKFSNSERKCEREFELYLKDMSSTMKADFRDLLKETKMLTYKTKQTLRETPHMMKDIESLLAKDKRYLQLDGMSEERHRLLLEYLDDMERKGPPPPPTASEPSRRLKA